MSLLDSLLGGYVYAQQDGQPSAAPSRRTLIFSGATVTDDGPTANSTTVTISGGGGSFPGGDLCSGTGTTVSVGSRLTLAGGTLSADAQLSGTSSQLAAGDGSAVTVGSGLTLAAGTLTASGGAGIATGLDSARPSAALVTVGSAYFATDSGVLYVCDSPTTWAVAGYGVGSDTATLGGGGGLSDYNYLASQASLTNGGGPPGAYGFCWVLNIYCLSVPAGLQVVWCNSAGTGSRGWEFGSSRTVAGNMSWHPFPATGTGTAGDIDLPGAPLSIGAHTLALTFTSTGETHYAFDGVLQTSIAAPTGTFLPADSSCQTYLGRWWAPSLGATSFEVGYVQAFDAQISDADLVTLSSNPSAHRPQNIATQPDYMWCAEWFSDGQTAQRPIGTYGVPLYLTQNSGVLTKVYR